jgi:thiamine monophosphate synthase
LLSTFVNSEAVPSSGVAGVAALEEITNESAAATAAARTNGANDRFER